MNTYFVIAAAVVSLLMAFGLYRKNAAIKVTDARMSEIAGYIHEGAMAYLKRQYMVMAAFAAIMFIFLALILDIQTALCFLLGALFSVAAGFSGMMSATRANVRTAQKAKDGMASALNVAFSGGAVLGLCVVGLGALGIAVLYIVFDGNNDILTGFSLGASSIALFARVGGGIYTKAADVGADLVGKVEAGIPEDDPRNPAVIGDNVGDNVGDVAGMGADLFESYVGAVLSSLLLAAGNAARIGLTFQLVAVGIVASLIGVLVVKTVKNGDPHKILNIGTYLASAILLVAAFFLCRAVDDGLKLFGAIASGIVAGVAIGFITEVYTSDKYKHVKHIAQQSETGAATTILSGFAVGLKSTGLPILLIVAAVVLSSLLAGLYGVALAAVGMLATVGITISVDAYGPVADNAGGIAEMSGMPHEIREITDSLDAVGNTTAAIGKGFSIGSAALTALALFNSYAQAIDLGTINLLDAKVVAGIFIGGMLVFLFCALTTESVSRAAQKMIEEVRRQFREIPGILEGKAKPDYARCVDISTSAALREMILPGVIAIAAPLACGLLLGAEALAGLLVGGTVVGVPMAIMMSNAGGAWDNAKKYIEGGAHGGKGSDAHKAAVTGDTVGDPFKDTSGPALNILIKLMSIVALVFVPLFL
ncbi:MAG: sodium-translocating pyrophosphatase [Clostridiaceae bacterium]|nr:sodium-translocating pyrophosphatase [Clostridiaceae bacterium]